MKKHIAIVIAVAMLTLAGCSENNDPSTDSGAGSSSGDASVAAKTTTDTTEASSDAETTTTTEAATAEAPKSPFADGIETPIDGVRLGMRPDDITAMFGEPSYKSEMDGVYYYNTDSVTAFSETYNAGSSIEFIFDSDGYLSVVNFNLGGQFKEDGRFERTGTYSVEQQKADFDKLYAIICEKAGDPSHKNNWGDKASCYTWTSDDLETNPIEYFIDEGDVDGLYANYVSFYIIAGTNSDKMPFWSLLPKEPVKATETTIAETTEPAKPLGDTVVFTDLEQIAKKVLDAHAGEPFGTDEEKLAFCDTLTADLESNGFEFIEKEEANPFTDEKGRHSENDYTYFSRTLSAASPVSGIDGLTLISAGGSRSDQSYSIQFTFEVENRTKSTGDDS
ncbi:MAG: hypothetical protein IJ871_09120, partial [Ruminococcus sp.]|nr:hypothetical protein [Ruminococcus sp.]